MTHRFLFVVNTFFSSKHSLGNPTLCMFPSLSCQVKETFVSPYANIQCNETVSFQGLVVVFRTGSAKVFTGYIESLYFLLKNKKIYLIAKNVCFGSDSSKM